MKTSVDVRGNNVIVNGEAIPCVSWERACQAQELLRSGGYHLTDEATEAEMLEEFGVSCYDEPEENFTDHIGMMSVTEQDADEYLCLLEDMLNARTQQERDAILKLCKEGSYPSVPELAIVALGRVGNVERARKLVNQISRKMPDVFRGMQEILSA
jgi:hypothetical protein